MHFSSSLWDSKDAILCIALIRIGENLFSRLLTVVYRLENDLDSEKELLLQNGIIVNRTTQEIAHRT